MTSKSGTQRHNERRAWKKANGPDAPRLRDLTTEDAAAARGVAPTPALREQIEGLFALAEEERDRAEAANEHAAIHRAEALAHGAEALRIDVLARRLLKHAPAEWALELTPKERP